MEVPVVATNVGGVSEALENGMTGIMIEPGHVDQAAEKIFSLIQDNQKLEQMGQAGRQFIQSRFDTKELNHKLEEIYYA